jgi:hypothetical protein
VLSERGDDREQPALVRRRPSRKILRGHRGDDPIGIRETRSIGIRIHDVDGIAHDLPEPRQRLRRRRHAEHEQLRRGQHRFEVDVHAASALTGHGKRCDARPPIGSGVRRKRDQFWRGVPDRRCRLARNGRLNAAAAQPAVVPARLGDDGRVAHLRRARRLAPHDDGEDERLALLRQFSGEPQDLGAHVTALS